MTVWVKVGVSDGTNVTLEFVVDRSQKHASVR